MESQWLRLAVIAIGTVTMYTIYSAYRVRSQVNTLRKSNLPMPEWNWVFGHLLVLRRYLLKFPSDTFINLIITDIGQDLGNVDMFYLDLWPFLAPTLFVCDSQAAIQASNKLNLRKPTIYKTMFETINGGPNLLSMNGSQWKHWRSLFNAGFSQSYLMEQIPVILDAVEIFQRRLLDTSGKVSPLQSITTPLTIDIISKVSMDLDLGCQLAPHRLANSLLKMIAWSSLGSPFAKYNVVRAAVLKYYGRIMNDIIGKEVRKRFTECQAVEADLNGKVRTPSKSIIALTLDDYAKDDARATMSSPQLDDEFVAHVTYQLRLFLFAGHDTVTSVLVFVYHLLYKNPDALFKMQKEHTEVFGLDPYQAATRLREDASLLNRTPYTLAVIKETMRLFPPAGALREGGPIPLYDRQGTPYPIENCLVSLSHHSIHRNPSTWRLANDFLPERWLVEAGHELYAPSEAFRPFEQGHRMCIGQNLSLIELRIALLLTVRTVNITPAYNEWDKVKRRWSIGAVLNRFGYGQGDRNTVDGDRAYQAEKGGAHPAESYPCTVTVIGSLYKS